MGTYVVISAEGPGADRAVEEAVAVLQEIHEHLTPSGKRSDLAALAAAPGRKTPVSAHLIKVLEIADEVNRISGGALDPSVGPLLRLWGFDGVSPPRTAPPTAREVREALSLTGWDDVIWDAAGLTATLERPGMALAVGAVAKGYAVDEAARALAETGVERAIIDAGGDLYLLGTRASGEPWRVAVRHPREEGFLGVLELPGDVAVTTSGDYERFFLHDGRRYHHILDPTTGWPVSGVVSVTVVAPTAAEADALATALFVMRPERGLELVESLDRVEALMVDETGALRLSSGMSDIFSPWPPGGDGGAAGEGDGSGAGEDGG
jgi:thiamine biosynthesis lipoprotein